jgi:aldehyde dehydrogenase (NAD+)
MDLHDYAAATESTNIVTIQSRYGLYIDGEFCEPASKKYFDTINPATEDVLSQIADANENDVDRAVKAASRAFPAPNTYIESHAYCKSERGNLLCLRQ